MVVINNSTNNYLEYFLILTLTILIEVGIAFIFKTRKYHVIALVNLITNVCLQVLMINLGAISTSIIYFGLVEIAIVLIEGITYLKILKIDKKKTIIYTLVANLITAVLTFLI